MKHVAKQIYKHILGANKMMLVPHQNPDGDTLGSVAAFIHFLEKIGKDYTAYCSTDISKKLAYLPHSASVSNDASVWNDSEIDTLILFDSGDLRYAGIDQHVEKLTKKPTIINFDHHATNEYFGDYNIVMDKESSTTAIIYRFFVYNDITIDQDIATCLLTGLVTDTDNFTNGGTTIASLIIASKLIEKGGDLKLIKQSAFKDKSVKGLQLWGAILSRLIHHKETDIVHTYVTQEDIKKHSVEETEIEGVANFMNNLQDGRAGLILKELEDGNVKGSFRTTRDDTNVAQYAKHLGGGGHKKAAGFTIEGPIHNAVERVLDAVMHIDKLALQEVEI